MVTSGELFRVCAVNLFLLTLVCGPRVRQDTLKQEQKHTVFPRGAHRWVRHECALKLKRCTDSEIGPPNGKVRRCHERGDWNRPGVQTGGGGSLRSCWFLVLFQPSIPNPSMWRRADRRAERPAITHRHLATRAWIKLNKKNNKRRSSNLKVQTVPEVSKSKVPRRLLIRGKLRLFVFVHKRERRRERKRGKPRTSRLS